MKTMMQFSLVAVNGRGFQPRTVERSDDLVGHEKIQGLCIIKTGLAPFSF